MPVKAVQRAGDELYAAPPTEFTKRRDEIVRRLRKEGRRDEADAVKALRKPTAAAWALNQLARRRQKDVQRLLAAGKRLRKAHEALYSGGDRAALERASADERELIDGLTRDAAAVAGEAGIASSAALDERLRDTLHAAALDEDTAAELAAGRLVRERDAIGLFGAGTAAAGTPKPQAAKKRDAQATARKALDHARKDAAEAEKRLERARNRAEEARAALRDAEQGEKDAARAYDRAARAVATAEKKVG